MATQIFMRNRFLNLYREGEKLLTFVCFLLLLKREIKIIMHLQPIPPFGDPWPSFPLNSISKVSKYCLLCTLSKEDIGKCILGKLSHKRKSNLE